MNILFDPALKAHLTLDDKGRVRGINHFDRYWESAGESDTALEAAVGYVSAIASVLRLAGAQLGHLHEPVSYLLPREQGVEYRLAEQKVLFDSATIGFVQTVANVPVWGAGTTVTLKQGPARVVAAVDTSHEAPTLKLPGQPLIAQYRRLFAVAEAERRLRDAGLFPPPSLSVAPRTLRGAAAAVESETAGFVRALVAGPAPRAARGRPKATTTAQAVSTRVVRGRFFAYRYDPGERFAHEAEPVPESPGRGQDAEPTLPLPPVDKSIQPGEYRLVAEITFPLGSAGRHAIMWLALVDVGTASVLYLRALASGVNGMVFSVDPITGTGNAANTPAQNNATLNPLRSSVVLPSLNAPVAGTQSLRGTRAAVLDVEGDVVAPPTKPSGTDFDYNVRSNDFAAVNAYYHVDRLFQTFESLGFALASYFDGTTFPVSADHRDMGLTINAHCIGNGAGGIGHVGYALNDLGDTANPIGRACDSRVTWHELGGHGVLYDHVNSANFGFSHSAGDSLSVIFHDPTSQAPDRFRYAPWNPINTRRIDRGVAAWAWGSAVVLDAMGNLVSGDDRGYGSEQILATTLFRVYRSIGGDSTDLGRRQFASRMAMWLILRAIATLTPATNPGPTPGNPEAGATAFANALMAADALNWTSEGVYGGAYAKVLRWSFEKQGLYQPAGTPHPITTVGTPPTVDVYIDDGRAGEYAYQPVHWNTTTIWNRHAADGLTTHEEPILSQPNFVYVRVKNRGTQSANNVRVKGFHCKPSAGLLWPNDLEPMTTAEIVVGTLAASNTEEKIVGPFTWTPNLNAWGHDCLLMIASADGDTSNVDNFTVGEVVPEWRLVPNDNNIGQRNVFPAAGGGGMEGLMQSLHGKSLWIGNPGRKRATMDLRVTLPGWLAATGWRLGFAGLAGAKFELAPGAKREVVLELQPGRDFERSEVDKATQRDLEVRVHADGALIGGMTYRLDPDVKRPVNPAHPLKAGSDCRKPAGELLHCLNLPAGEVDCVRIRRVSLDIDLRNDCDC